MSFSWTYLTRRFVLMNYRDYVAVSIIGSYAVGKTFQAIAEKDDTVWTMQHVYTEDESDVAFKEVTNKTDGAVKRKLALAYCDKIKMMRAERERAAQLDAYNYLNGKNLEL